MTIKEAEQAGYDLQMNHTRLSVQGKHDEAKKVLASLRTFVATHETSLVHAYKKGIMRAEQDLSN